MTYTKYVYKMYKMYTKCVYKICIQNRNSKDGEHKSERQDEPQWIVAQRLLSTRIKSEQTHDAHTENTNQKNTG